MEIERKPLPGQIWLSIEGKHEIILAHHENSFCTVLLLQEKPNKYAMFMKNQFWYTNPAMIGTMFDRNLDEYVMDASPDDFAKILDQVSGAILGGKNGPSTEPDDIERLITRYHSEAKEANDLCDKMKADYAGLSERFSKAVMRANELEAENERLKKSNVNNDIPWEKMYNHLLERVLNRMEEK